MKCKVAAKGCANLVVKRYLGPFWIRRRQLNKTQWLRSDQLRVIQIKLLQRLIRHCYKTVPYYRRIMDERGVKPEHIKSLEDIKLFPILTKEDVLVAGSSIYSTKYPKWITTVGLTGGTTGTPLRLPRNLFAIENEHAFVRRQWDWAGVGFRDCTAWLSGRVIIDVNKTTGRLYKYDPLMKELILSTYHLSKDNAVHFLEAIKCYHTKAIVGYSSSIYFLAKCALDFGIHQRLKAVLTTSEMMSEPMRNTIQKAFGCMVYDFYGAAERVCYIHTCPKGSYHLIPEYGYTEFIPENGFHGCYDKIVATGFWNYAMPLIRYNTEDAVIRSDKSCSCGREFELIESIVGRTGDVLITPSGRRYSPTLLARVTKQAENILESQVVQDAVDHINILYIPGKNFTNDDLVRFREQMLENMPRDLKIDLKHVSAIEKTSRGKMNHLVSKI